MLNVSIARLGGLHALLFERAGPPSDRPVSRGGDFAAGRRFALEIECSDKASKMVNDSSHGVGGHEFPRRLPGSTVASLSRLASFSFVRPGPQCACRSARWRARRFRRRALWRRTFWRAHSFVGRRTWGRALPLDEIRVGQASSTSVRYCGGGPKPLVVFVVEFPHTGICSILASLAIDDAVDAPRD